MVTWRYDISLLMLKKYFIRSLRSLMKYFSTLEEKFRISTWPCNILYFYLLPPSKQFETTTNQEILKAFVMSQGVLFSCVKSHPRFSNFLLQSFHFFLSKVSIIIQSWVFSFLSSLLKTEMGRYEEIPCNERICSFCNSNKIEDENHFLLDCEAYSKIRDQSL